MAEAPGILEINSLADAGFSDNEILAHRNDTARGLYEAGFSDKEVNDYFGTSEPDLAPVKELFKTNTEKNMLLAEQKPANAADPGNPDGPGGGSKPAGINSKSAVSNEGQIETFAKGELQAPKLGQAKTFTEALEAGWDMSVSGLLAQQKSPDMVMGEHPELYMRIASQVAQLAGDLPFMVAGSFAGGATLGAAGSVVPVLGTGIGVAAGAGFGANALPEAMRTVLMDHYEKGDIKDFNDFWSRSSAAFINSVKAGAVGAVTLGAGKGVGGALANKALAPVVKTTAQLMSEVATMTTVGAALEGHMPRAQDFLDASILVGGLHVATMAPQIPGKMRNVFAKTGESPIQLADKVQVNPKLQQEMMAANQPIPPSAIEGTPILKEAIPEGGFKSEPLKNGEAAHDIFKEAEPLKEGETAPIAAEKLNGLSDDTNKILSKIGETTEKKSKLPTFNEMYTNFVDKLNPINEATKVLTENAEGPLAADKNPYVLARTAVDAKAKAKHFFEKATFDFKTLENNGPSLKSTLESVPDPKVLEAYLVSKRAIEKSTQGKATGFDVEAAKNVVKEHGPLYEKAAQQVTDFSNKVLDYAVQAGLVSEEASIAMREANKDYVPFKRISEATEGGATKAGSKGGSLKEFRGSEKDIQSPILSIVENTADILQRAENNRASRSLIELAEQSGAIGEGKMMEKVAQPAKPVTISEEQMAKHFEKIGVDPEHAEAITTYTKQTKDLAPNQFDVWRDGKREIYETDKNLAEAMNRLGGDKTARSLLVKMMAGVTTIKKMGITLTPDFVVKNLTRDFFTASAFTEGKAQTPFEALGGILSAGKDLVKENDTYYKWLKSGGANGAFIELDTNYIAKDIFKLQEQTGFMGSARNYVRNAVDYARMSAEVSEQSLRLAEFKKVVGDSDKASDIMRGGYASREVTVDFQRIGAKMSAINAITAFQNVAIQGLDRTARAIKADPVGTTTKAISYITMPSVLLWYANKDDQRVQELPRWQKDTFWIVATDKWEKASDIEGAGLPEHMLRKNANGETEVNHGTLYRIPKPQELGLLFGTLPERMMDQFFTDNPHSFKEFGKSLGGMLTPALIPDAVSPAIEQYFNKSFFTGSDIVPHQLQGVKPEYQYVEYTSETAKAFGKIINNVTTESDFRSPLVIDNYIRSWTGAIGQYATQLADKGLTAAGIAEEKNKPSSTLADMPIIKSFVARYPLANSESVQDFKDEYKESQVVQNTLALLKKRQDFGNLEKEYLDPENQQKMIRLDGINESLKAQSDFVMKLNKDPDMKPEEKRQLIDQVYFQMTAVAKEGKNMMREFKKTMKERK